MKDWTFNIYVFYAPVPAIEYVNGQRCHIFKCLGKSCKQSVRHFLTKADKASTSNMRKHIKSCWGKDILKMVSEAARLDVACNCQNWFLQRTPTKVEESGRAYISLGTRQEGRRFEDVGLSLCASPLQILVLGFQRTEFWWSMEVPKASGGQRETEEMEEFAGSIQCDIQTEELPPQHAQYLYYTAEM